MALVVLATFQESLLGELSLTIHLFLFFPLYEHTAYFGPTRTRSPLRIIKILLKIAIKNITVRFATAPVITRNNVTTKREHTHRSAELRSQVSSAQLSSAQVLKCSALKCSSAQEVERGTWNLRTSPVSPHPSYAH